MTQKVSIEPTSIQTNISGTITTGGTAQTISEAKEVRNGFWIQNLSTSPLYFRVGGTAVQGQPCVKLNPGVLYENPVGVCPTGLISIIGPLTGAEFSAREW